MSEHTHYRTADKYIIIVPDESTYEKLYKKIADFDRSLIEVIPYCNILYDPTENDIYQKHVKVVRQ